MLSNYEKKVFKKGYKKIAGIDEAGRGCLAGPVCAVAVVFNCHCEPRRSRGVAIPCNKTGLLRSLRSLAMTKIKDSKQLSEKKREEIFELVKNNPDIEWKVSFVWPKVIDRINIWQATLLAWKRSLKKLKNKPDFLFLDGNQMIKGLKIKQQAVVKGDEKIFVLSLASIMAKVSRDRLMKKLHQKYPQYGLARHKGYGTKLHFAKLNQHGSCIIHRKSFSPVKEIFRKSKGLQNIRKNAKIKQSLKAKNK